MSGLNKAPVRLMRYLWRIYFIGMMLGSPARLFANLQQQSWYKNMLLHWLRDYINGNKGDCLEIGCGPGIFSAELAAKGVRVTAVDSSRSMIEFAKRRFAAAPTKPEFAIANAKHLEFFDQCFDLVVAASLINVVREPVAVIREMLRVARDDGYIAVLVPSPSLNPSNAAKYSQAHALSHSHAAALGLWASAARKLSRHELENYFQLAGAVNLRIEEGLDGMVFFAYAQLNTASL